MMHELLAGVLSAKVEPIDTLEAWRARHRSIARAYQEPILAAIAAAAGTDRLAWAFGSGYQSAGRRLFGLDPERLGALCATEAGGAHPRAIETRLDESGALFGVKSFVTFGLEAEVLIVIASEGRDAAGLNRLRAVMVERDAPGLAFEALGPTPFVPEISHATLRLDGARGRVLEGDGYLAYLKPFRTVEDTHVLAAATSHAITLGNAGGFDEPFFERAVSTLLALVEIARMPPLAPHAHVALAGAQDNLRSLVEQVDQSALPEPLAALWKRDRPLLSVAGKARAQRRIAAWARIRELPDTSD